VGGMAARAIEVLSDDKKREIMGANARQRASDSFSSDKIITRYETLYEQVVRKVQATPEN